MIPTKYWYSIHSF